MEELLTPKTIGGYYVSHIKEYLPTKYQSLHFYERTVDDYPCVMACKTPIPSDMVNITDSDVNFDDINDTENVECGASINIHHLYVRYSVDHNYDVDSWLRDEAEAMVLQFSKHLSNTNLANDLTDKFLDYEKCKTSIYPRLVNKIYRKTNGPCIEFCEGCDFVIEFVVDLDKLYQFAVTTALLDNAWGLTIDMLYEQSLENVRRASYSIVDMASKAYTGDSKSIKVNEIKRNRLYSLSGRYGVQGAGSSVILNKTLLHKIYKKFGEFYILPYTKETVILASTSVFDRDFITNLVASRAESIHPLTVLSRYAYRFDGEHYHILND